MACSRIIVLMQAPSFALLSYFRPNHSQVGGAFEKDAGPAPGYVKKLAWQPLLMKELVVDSEEPCTGCGQYERSQVLEMFPLQIPCSLAYARSYVYPF